MEKVKVLIMNHRMAVAVVAIILAATILVSISMLVYYKSGAFQLDLSRPEYKSVRSQIDTDTKTTDNFDSQGVITEEVLEDFLKRYKERADRVLEANAYSNDVLSDEQLGLGDSEVK